MRHELKTWPTEYEAVRSGAKRHEVRVNDRKYSVGDTLCLREHDPATKTYSGAALEARVTYVTPGGIWGLPTHVDVLSIEVVTSVAPQASRDATGVGLDRTTLLLLHTWGLMGLHLKTVRDLARDAGYDDAVVAQIDAWYRASGYARKNRGV